MSGPIRGATPEQFAQEFSIYLSARVAFKLQDGRPVLGAFYAEAMPVSWWTTVLNLLKNSYGLSVAFVPTFLVASPYLNAFASICYGFGNWGGRTHNSVPLTNTGPGSPAALAQRAHSQGKIWMQPIAFQDVRPAFGAYWESANSTTLIQGWQAAISQGADWIQLVT